MLAGGLTPENVAEAIRKTGARQVDVASGVETAPAQKDADLMRAFVEAAQAVFECGEVFVGEVGERRVFKLTVKRSRAFNGDYGIYRIITLEDEHGNVIVYKGGSDELYLDDGESVEAKATVKEHGEFNNVKQTTITRPKAIN